MNWHHTIRPPDVIGHKPGNNRKTKLCCVLHIDVKFNRCFETNKQKMTNVLVARECIGHKLLLKLMTLRKPF